MKKLLLTLVLLSGLSVAFSQPLAMATASASVTQSGAVNSYSLLAQMNGVRRHSHERSLRMNSRLTNAAYAKAYDMANNNYWAHFSPSGRSPWSFISAAGYRYRAAGENLAYGFDSASGVYSGWMNSPSHRANVLKARYRDVGIAVVHTDSFMGQGPQTIVVAEFGSTR